jgi:hypothetical protein
MDLSPSSSYKGDLTFFSPGGPLEVESARLRVEAPSDSPSWAGTGAKPYVFVLSIPYFFHLMWSGPSLPCRFAFRGGWFGCLRYRAFSHFSHGVFEVRMIKGPLDSVLGGVGRRSGDGVSCRGVDSCLRNRKLWCLLMMTAFMGAGS